MRVTKISQNGLTLLKSLEGFSSKPYLDGGGVPTIGYGSTYYENGVRVTMKDTPISEEWSEKLLLKLLEQYERDVDSYTRDDINQNQFDALVLFAYNVGSQALKRATLLKKVNINPIDPTIEKEFLKWIYDNGKKVQGLLNRRIIEAKLYHRV